MKTLTVKQRIIDVLISNQDMYLTAREIAELGYGEAYIRDTANGLNAKIARNMNGAITQLRDETKLEVVGKYLPRTPQEKKAAKRNNKSGTASDTSPYMSYKIAGIEDQDDIIGDLQKRKERIERYITLKDIRIENFKKIGLMIEQ